VRGRKVRRWAFERGTPLCGMHGRDVTLFDRFAPLYERAMPPADRATLERGLAEATRPIERILDVGGGTGRAARVLPGEVTVVDAARGMLVEAGARSLPGVQADSARLPIRDECVDAVVIVDAFHHFADQQGTLGEAARVLRPGGVLVLREFDRATLRGRGLVLAERVVGFDSTFHTADELADTVEAVGLEARIPERGFGCTVTGRKSGTVGPP
jgi:ubiquinone/menaquinone biosynthesis C-methylase UbiE